MSLLCLLLMLVSAPAADPGLETVFPFAPERPPGNGRSGRLFMTLQEFYGEALRVVEEHTAA